MSEATKENIQKASDIGNEGDNRNINDIDSVTEKKAGVEEAGGQLTYNSRHNSGDEHAQATAAAVILSVVYVTQSTCLPFVF